RRRQQPAKSKDDDGSGQRDAGAARLPAWPHYGSWGSLGNLYLAGVRPRGPSMSVGIFPARLIEHRGEPPAERRRNRERHAWLLANKHDESAAIQTQDLAIGLHLDGCSPLNIVKQSHLAEGLARMQHFHLHFGRAGTVGCVHAHRSARDQIKGIADVALAENDRARRVEQRLQMCRKLGQHDAIEPNEQIDPAEQARICEVVAGWRELCEDVWFVRQDCPLPTNTLCVRIFRRVGPSRINISSPTPLQSFSTQLTLSENVAWHISVNAPASPKVRFGSA